MSEPDNPLLNLQEIVQIQAIIAEHPFIKQINARGALLANCRLQSLTNLLDGLEASTGVFLNNLFAEVNQSACHNADGESALVALLTYLVENHQDKLSLESKLYLQKVIDTYGKVQGPSYAREQQWRQSFTIQREIMDRPYSTKEIYTRKNYREEIITTYDLDKAMGEFRAPLVQGQALGFMLASDRYLLRKYVIERIKREFKDKLPGNHFIDEIPLHIEDLSKERTISTLLEEKIKQHYNYPQASDLIVKHFKQHIVLVLWNHNIPGAVLREAAIAFWQSWLEKTSTFLQRKKLCFVLILAHLPPEAELCLIDNFIPLQIPSNFDIQNHVIPWIDGKLRMLQVKPRDIKYCCDRLNDPYADQVEILMQLEHIADYLQGTYEEGRYDNNVNHFKKRQTRR